MDETLRLAAQEARTLMGDLLDAVEQKREQAKHGWTSDLLEELAEQLKDEINSLPA